MKTDLNVPGAKDDGGKLRYDLVPTSAIAGLAEVLTFGANKYTPNGWKVVPDAIERYYSAAFRHLIAWRDGEELDQESKLNHLKHVMTNVAFLLELTKNNNYGQTLSNSIDDCSDYHCSLKNCIESNKKDKEL